METYWRGRNGEGVQIAGWGLECPAKPEFKLVLQKLSKKMKWCSRKKKAKLAHEWDDPESVSGFLSAGTALSD